ncbi:type II CAAX prenyl endopeptidase Rce1 family protein [Pedobacter sp. L105]|uniref:CPBP family glutamic-type intramembrane protease n=1 Tax=Pedobacter sp. L105 TaxID=1641871 RepID=UPI00131CA5DC|nr:CPBP family glutamic-type intramembrane protease [Pedobacter sp. L105]
MLTFLAKCLNYLKDPYLVSIPKKITSPFTVIFMLSAICIIAGVFAGVFADLLVHLKLVPAPGPSILDDKEVSPFHFFIGAVLIAPVTEELIFRAQLKRFTGAIFFIAFMCGVLLCAITKNYWAFLISPVIFILLFIIYRFTIAGSVTRKFTFWVRAFPWYFHFTSICFALVHLSNFQKGITLLPLGILYTLPQLAIGLVLGFTRMNYGLKYSIAIHALYNLSFAILLLSKY